MEARCVHFRKTPHADARSDASFRFRGHGVTLELLVRMSRCSGSSPFHTGVAALQSFSAAAPFPQLALLARSAAAGGAACWWTQEHHAPHATLSPSPSCPRREEHIRGLAQQQQQQRRRAHVRAVGGPSAVVVCSRGRAPPLAASEETD